VKAFVVERYGEDGLRAADVPEPEVGAADVLVKVSAASVNPLDRMVRDGEFKRLLEYGTPFVLGHDVTGVVTRVGAAVRDFQVGDEVYARPRDLRIGTFAEYIAIDHVVVCERQRAGVAGGRPSECEIRVDRRHGGMVADPRRITRNDMTRQAGRPTSAHWGRATEAPDTARSRGQR
jgi:Alcohol dehydrogenase GroES-like domain